MSKRTRYFLVFLACSILIYELPYFLTLRKTGWTPLPPVLSMDQFLYLNLSCIHHASATEVVNPWYGNRVPASAVAYLRFPITFLLFRGIHWFFRSWTAAMLVWAGIWAGLTFAAGFFCLNSLFPNSDRRLTAIGAFGLLALQSPLTYAAEIVHLPSTTGFLDLWLPFTRFAFPQVIVPVVLAYWALQVRALTSGSKWKLGGMVLLQFAACAAFPYILPVIAFGTAITIAIAQCRRSEIAPSRTAVFVFAAACGVLDIGYLVLAGLGTTNGNVQFALQFRPEMILPSFRPYVLLLVVGSIFALMSRTSWAARATVAGLALSNALFAFSLVLFPPSTMMLNHVNYILTLTTWLPLMAVLWAWFEKFNGRPLRVALTSILALVALWEGFATYRTNLPVNTLQAAAIEEVEKLALTSKDLIVAPGQFSDDISSWVPLVSRARILYTPNSENILSLEGIRTEQTSRQALYLALEGMNLTQLTSITESDKLGPLNALEQHGDRGYHNSPLEADRLHVRTILRERLGPLLSELQSNPTSANPFFSGYERVVVVDGSSEPLFQPSAFAPWLEIEQAYQRNGTRVWVCRPKGAS
jgi:hypothetical protein